MDQRKIHTSEEKSLARLQNIQLPSSFKKVGVGIVIASLVGLILKKTAGMEAEMIAHLLKSGLIVGLLIISIAKDKEEDEMIVKLRAQSYTAAFIATVIYTLITPYINIGVDALVSFQEKKEYSMASFQILFYMLGLQIMFFHLFKRKS